MSVTRYAVLLAACSTLSACGGGGGGVSTSTILEELPLDNNVREGLTLILDDENNDEAATPAAAYVRSSDFNSHWGHEFSGVENAYARGIDGSGVTVAVFDDGVESGNSEFSGRMLAGFDAFTNAANGDALVNNACDGLGGCDTGRHGTLVAGVIGAANDSTGAHGVAPGVRIFSVNIDTRSDDGAFSSQEISNVRAFTAALNAGARIFNHSYAIAYDPTLRAGFEAGGGGIYDRLADSMRAGSIHVYASGNDGTDQPSMESLWPVWKPDLEGGIIAVTGIVRDHSTGQIQLASYANKCGDAQDWCLSAPTGDFGANERFTGLVAAGPDGSHSTFDDPDQDGLQDSVGGTSTAAAYVSGALALLKQAFPELTGEQIGLILLDTATDLGTTGTDATYGRGAVNIAEAIRPQGTVSVASGATIAAGMTPLSETSLSLNSAMASVNLLKGQKMVFFDGYGRAYNIDPSTLVSESAPYRESLSRLSATLDGLDAVTRNTGRDESKFSFGVSSNALGASAKGAADAETLLMLVMKDGDGAIRVASSEQFGGGFLALAPDATASVIRYALSPKSALSVTMGSSRPLEGEGREDIATLDYAYSVNDRLALGLRAGLLHENDGLLGSSGDGPLSLSDKSLTHFVEGRFAQRMSDNIALIGELGVGQTDPGSTSGYLGFDGPLTSVETRLGLALSNLGRDGDQLTVSGGIPLHVVDGTAKTRLPTGRDAAGNVNYTTTETALGGDIPVEMRLDYAVPLSEKLSVGINSAVRREGTSEVYGDLAVGMRLKF